MKGELKAGGLALVLNSTISSNIGKCVTLVKYVTPGDKFIVGNISFSFNPENGQPGWFCTGDVSPRLKSGMIVSGWSLFPANHLMPIDDSDPDLVQDKEKEYQY